MSATNIRIHVRPRRTHALRPLFQHGVPSSNMPGQQIAPRFVPAGPTNLLHRVVFFLRKGAVLTPYHQRKSLTLGQEALGRHGLPTPSCWQQLLQQVLDPNAARRPRPMRSPHAWIQALCRVLGHVHGDGWAAERVTFALPGVHRTADWKVLYCTVQFKDLLRFK